MTELKTVMQIVSAVEHLKFGLLIVDRALSIRYCNPSAAQQLKLIPTDCIGRRLTGALPELDNPEWHALLAQAQSSGTACYARLPLPQSGVSVTNVNVLLYGFSDEMATSCLAVVLMPGEQAGSSPVAASSHLLQTEKMQAIAQLAASAAHEINNPVGFIASNLKSLASYVQQLLSLVDEMSEWGGQELQQLKQRYDYDFIRDDISGLLNDSNVGVDRIKRILGDLHELSLSDGSSLSQIDLSQCAENALCSFKKNINQSVKFSVQYSALPRIEGNVEQLNKLISSLLLNAVQAIEGSGNINLRTGTCSDGVWLEIEDDGCGISNDQQKRIFEPFFTTRPLGKGTGIGLALAFNIVQRHQGQLSVISTLGEGSCFKIWLPIKQFSTTVCASGAAI